eukprot:517977_1
MALQKDSKLSIQSSTDSKIDDEDDKAVGAAFLGISRPLVKTAREPKPPKDYVDSSKDVISAADTQKSQAKLPKKKGKIRQGPSISVGNDDKLLDKALATEQKQNDASDDKNKKNDKQKKTKKTKTKQKTNDDQNQKSDK